MSNQPFIRQLTLRNILSFGPESAPIELGPLNVLIGPNGSGKSNFIEAIGVLRAATRDLTAPFKESGIAEWPWKGPAHEKQAATVKIEAVFRQPQSEMGLRYHIALTSGTASTTELHDESLENEIARPGESEPYFYYRYEGGYPVLDTQAREYQPAHWPQPDQAREMPRRKFRIEPGELIPNRSILCQKNDPVFYPEISYLAKQLGAISIYRMWDTGQSSPIRMWSRADDLKSHLSDDASNLALVLNGLWKRGEVRKQILQRLKSFYDRAEDIGINIFGNQVLLAIQETGADTTISASRLSDGTLRFLALLAVIYNPTPPPVICIEEPELGMHPDVIPVIAEMLIEASERTQLIVTTHSDFLVSKLRDLPEAIMVCDWSESGTTMRRLTKEDVADWPDNVSLGDIWLKGGFGGTRW